MKSYSDAAVIAIAQHCPKLKSLHLKYTKILCTSLLALSERCLSLEELHITFIPSIPTADIARRCSHALSCICHLNTDNFNWENQDTDILIPYMTGLTSVQIEYYCQSYIHLLTQYCHKLTEILVYDRDCTVADILPLCCANPLLQIIDCFSHAGITHTSLIELIHACPHLHTLYLTYETDITDIGILTLSEHCPRLKVLNIFKCVEVTEPAVLQLLQRCRKLTRLVVSNSSLSEETWTQLDRNTQQRVRQC